MPIGIIYCATNIINGKQYIGQTIQALKERWRSHLSEAKRGRTTPLCAAIRKNGKSSFRIEQIGQAENFDCLNTLEVAAIKRINTLVPYGYNLDDGGKNKNTHLETKNKISKSVSISLIGNKRSLGRKHSEEVKAKIRLKNLGRKHSQETKDKISKSNKGKHMTIESRTKMSNSKRGKIPANFDLFLAAGIAARGLRNA